MTEQPTTNTTDTRTTRTVTAEQARRIIQEWLADPHGAAIVIDVGLFSDAGWRALHLTRDEARKLFPKEVSR